MALAHRSVVAKRGAATAPAHGAQRVAVVRPVVATRASAKEEALKMAGDLLKQGVAAVKNADKEQVCVADAVHQRSQDRCCRQIPCGAIVCAAAALPCTPTRQTPHSRP